MHKEEIGKLQIGAGGAEIKLEVNLVARGTLAVPETMTLCARAQKEFDAFCAIQVVPFGQLYGGKIRAALDRQHPRDLFDVKDLLENEGFSDEVSHVPSVRIRQEIQSRHMDLARGLGSVVAVVRNKNLVDVIVQADEIAALRRQIGHHQEDRNGSPHPLDCYKLRGFQ